MHLLIDRERLCVLYKHPNLGVLSNIAHIEAAHSPVTIAHYDDYQYGFASLTDWELRVLHEHLCGQKYTGYIRDHLERTIVALCECVPESDIVPHEVLIQAACIPEGDDRYYKYVKGSSFPNPQEDLFAAPALKTPQGIYPAVPITAPEKTPPASCTLAAALLTTARKPAEGSAPRSSAPRPESNEPPKQGSKTGRVWTLADDVLAKHAAPYEWKKVRAEVAAACEADGINSSTMSVQFSKWKKTKESS
jgi:hypothetical protein